MRNNKKRHKGFTAKKEKLPKSADFFFFFVIKANLLFDPRVIFFSSSLETLPISFFLSLGFQWNEFFEETPRFIDSFSLAFV